MYKKDMYVNFDSEDVFLKSRSFVFGELVKLADKKSSIRTVCIFSVTENVFVAVPYRGKEKIDALQIENPCQALIVAKNGLVLASKSVEERDFREYANVMNWNGFFSKAFVDGIYRDLEEEIRRSPNKKVTLPVGILKEQPQLRRAIYNKMFGRAERVNTIVEG